MPSNIKLSSRLLSDVFWSVVLKKDDERQTQKQALVERLVQCDGLRSEADYNTGSISVTDAWCLYNLVRHFQPSRIIEIGTFIGKSTVSMASAMDHNQSMGQAPGQIFTCDLSNSIRIPWDGMAQIHQHVKTSSGDMLRSLTGPFDMVYLDGRMPKEDLPLLDAQITDQTLFVLDDFEGMEKGVVNTIQLMTLKKLSTHFLIYPPSPGLLASRGHLSHSLTSVLMPVSWFAFTRQG